LEFLAAVIAIVAIILAFRLRKRLTTLEAHVALLNGRLDAKPEGVAQAAAEILFPEQPAAAKARGARTRSGGARVSLPQSPPLSGQPDEAAIDGLRAAAQACRRRRANTARNSVSAATRRRPRRASKSASGQAGSCGSVALRWRSAASSWCILDRGGLIGPGVRIFLGGCLPSR